MGTPEQVPVSQKAPAPMTSSATSTPVAKNKPGNTSRALRLVARPYQYPAHHQKIFERFYQVTEAEEKTFPGLGMGLYISHEIVLRHQGRMWVESRKDEGSTFSVALPLLQEDS